MKLIIINIIWITIDYYNLFKPLFVNQLEILKYVKSKNY